MKKGRVTGNILPVELTVKTTITVVREGLHRSRVAVIVPNHMRRGCTEAFFLGSSLCHGCVLQTLTLTLTLGKARRDRTFCDVLLSSSPHNYTLIANYKKARSPAHFKTQSKRAVLVRVIFKSNNCDGLFTFWLMLHYPVHKR